MTTCRKCRPFILFWALAVSLSSAARSQDQVAGAKVEGNVPAAPAWRVAAERVLSLGDQKEGNASQRETANRELSQLRPAKEDDPRWQYAFVLVAMHFEKWPSAESLANELLVKYPDYLPGYVGKTRILMKLNKVSQALVALESLAERLRNESEHVTREQKAASARFLGLCVGYFSGPGKGLIKPIQLADLEAAAERIPEDVRKDYEESLNLITREFKVMVEEGEAALVKLRQNLQTEAETLRRELEAAQAKTAADADAARSTLETRWAQSQSQWQTAWNNCQAIAQSANGLLQQQLLLEGNLAALPPPPVDQNGNVHPNDELRYQAAVANLQLLIGNLERQRFQLALQHDQAQAHGLAVERQMAVLQQESQILGLKLTQQNQSFNRMAQSIRAKDLAAKNAEPKKSAAQRRAEQAFRTYDDFNFHKEKKLLLAK